MCIIYYFWSYGAPIREERVKIMPIYSISSAILLLQGAAAPIPDYTTPYSDVTKLHL